MNDMSHYIEENEDDEWVDIGTDVNKSFHTIELPEPINEEELVGVNKDDIGTNDLIASMEKEMTSVTYNDIEYDIHRRCFVKIQPTSERYVSDCLSETFKELCNYAYWNICFYIDQTRMAYRFVCKRTRIIYNVMANRV